jgi:hypothetical protein
MVNTWIQIAEMARTENNMVEYLNAMEQAHKENAKLKVPDFAVSLNYGESLLRVGEPRKAKDIFLSVIGCHPFAVSNYYMACDYLGIPNKLRHDIKPYYPQRSPESRKPRAKKNDRIRIAYLTSDIYGNHPVAKLLHQIIKQHDREKYHISIFHDQQKMDDTSWAIVPFVDKFIRCANIPSKDLEPFFAEHNIDVAIDTNGHTNGGPRLCMFAHGIAPIQIAAIGYPSLCGLDCFDFEYASLFYKNEWGFAPLIDLGEEKRLSPAMYDFGVVAKPAKILPDDIRRFDSYLIDGAQTTLAYIRRGTDYTQQWIDNAIALHNPRNKDRVFFVQGCANDYDQMRCMLDTSAYQGHMTVLEALAHGCQLMVARRDALDPWQGMKTGLDVAAAAEHASKRRGLDSIASCRAWTQQLEQRACDLLNALT